ncbi:MAG: BMP family ABC transporter substrate-binding protein [Treponema sp.]|nr:BMP family ABC transporter substrate-binding protein [Treponema sp.]
MKLTTAFGLAAALSLAAVGAWALPGPPRVCVFVPGVVAGSSTYEQLVAGAKRAVAEVPGAAIKIVEAGFDQSQWLDKLSALAASGEFSLIVSSNPAMPDLARQVAESFPAERFFIADGYLPGNPRIHTVLYNQFEQGYLVGYLSGLVDLSHMPGVTGSHKAGLVIAQSYPTLDKLIEPGFEKGLKDADPEAVLETRQIGNWYDATKAAELASALFDSGVSVILPIAGGAGQGVVSAAQARGRRVVWFDGDGYNLAPGTVIGCAILRQEKLVYEQVKAILLGAQPYGTADVVGIRDGYVDFDGSGAAYKALPADLRATFEARLRLLHEGKLSFPFKGL